MLFRGAALVGALLPALSCAACSPGETPSDARRDCASPLHAEGPTLVVGIVVDQMRPDLVHRYWDKLSEKGFKRILSNGFSFNYARHQHFRTLTAPGHATIYTGTTPSVHGVIGNSWYARDERTTVDAVSASGYEGIGTIKGGSGSKAPSNLLSTTIGDELRLHSNNRAKVVGISLKDRSAIFSAGHTGDAYWYEESTGRFVTSTYYRDNLPEWLVSFNAQTTDHYVSWSPLLPFSQYTESIEDDNKYDVPLGRFLVHEGLLPHPIHRAAALSDATFPHDLLFTDSAQELPQLLLLTPSGNRRLTDLAIAVIEGEHLGGDPVPDLLGISYSAPDYVGHLFGPASMEVQDIYLRLDEEIARLVSYLSDRIPDGRFLMFLTSDHGVMHFPEYLSDQRIPSTRFPIETTEIALRSYLTSKYGADVLLTLTANQIYLDRQTIQQAKMNYSDVSASVVDFLMGIKGVVGAVSAEVLIQATFYDEIRRRVQNGYHFERSGDIVYWLAPNVLSVSAQSLPTTSHGSPWIYDAHVPLYWYGRGIPSGNSNRPVATTDIAPTLSILMQTPFPSGSTGTPLAEILN